MIYYLHNCLTLFDFVFNSLQASAHNKNLDVGANIFIGNLDPDIDEKLLYDTFSAFGVILQTPKVLLFFKHKTVVILFWFGLMRSPPF